jgi:hypothetical protein
MTGSRPSTRSSAALAAIAACLLVCLLPAPASARLRPITGQLDHRGITVVALAPHGGVGEARARPGFKVVPTARVVTLQLRDRRGAYLGPVVLRGRGGKVTLGVRAGANLGRIEVRRGYARLRRDPPPRAFDRNVSARARHGVPVGVGSLGWVRGRARGPSGPGQDRDRDGIPDKFDVDDNGNLVLDVRERGGPPISPQVRRMTDSLPLGACPTAVCSGSIDVHLSHPDKADVALIVSIVAALLAATSLGWQLLGLRRRRKRRVEVDVRLGLPIYRQGGGDWSVFIEVVNNTEHPVRWISAALELVDGRRLYLMQQPPGGELPAILEPHESHQTWSRVRELELGGLDLTEPVVATAKLDTGEVVQSPRRRLLSRSAAKRLRD